MYPTKRNFQFESENRVNSVQTKNSYKDSNRTCNDGNFLNSQKLSLIEKFFDSLISITIAGIFLGIPFFRSGISLQGIAFDKQMGFFFWTLIALIGWIGKSVIRGEMNLRRTPLDLPITIFWFAYALSTFFSIDRWHSFWGFSGNPTHGLANVTASIILYYVILSNFNLSRLRIAFGILIFSGAAIVVKEILEVNRILDLKNVNFIQAHHWSNFLIPNSIGSTSGTSIFVGVLIIVLVTVFIKTKSSEIAGFKKILLESIFLVLIAASLYLLLVLYHFTPWPGILIGTGFFLIYTLANVVKAEKKSIWLPFSVFVSVLLMMMIGSAVFFSLGIAENQFPLEVSLNSDLSWQILKKSILTNNFFVGSGPSTYAYDFSMYKPQDFNLNVLYGLRFNEGSGIFWEMLPTLGILGTFSFILLMVSFLSVGLYLLSRDSGTDKIYSLGLMASVLLILFDSFFMRLDVSITILGTMLAIFALGMVFAENRTEERYLKFSLKASPEYALVSAFVLLTIGTGTFFLFVLLAKIYVADIFAGLARSSGSISEESLKKIERAINFNGNEGKYYIFGGQQYMTLANNEFLKGKEADKILLEKYLDNAILLTSKGKELMSKDVVAVELFAEALENKSLYYSQFFDQTVLAYNDALILEPHNPTYFMKIGEIHAMQAALEKDENNRRVLTSKAKDSFQKAVDKKNNLAEAHFKLGSMQELLGEKDAAIISLQKATLLDNTNVDYFLMLASSFQSRGLENDYKNAENIYKSIIPLERNNLKTNFGLGLLYEKMKRFGDAEIQYKKVSELLEDNNKEAKVQIQKMIDNASRGIENTPESLKNKPEAISDQTTSETQL